LEKPKLVKVSPETWRQLMELKRRTGLESLDGVIRLLLTKQVNHVP